MKKRVFDTFSSEDLLRGNKWRGRALTDAEIVKLKEEAGMFRGSLLWKILQSELQWFALKSLIESGKDGEDIRIARAFGNIVQVIEKKLKEL